MQYVHAPPTLMSDFQSVAVFPNLYAARMQRQHQNVIYRLCS